MKRLLTGIFTATLLCGFAGAQNTPSAPTANPAPQAQAVPAQSATTPRIAPGSVIPVHLTKTIDVKKVKTGDEVEAIVTQDMKTENGEVMVPKDTKVVGRVTEARPRNKDQKESQIGIAFDRAVMKSGGDVNLPMSIQAIISPSYLSGNNSSNNQPPGQQPAAAGGVQPGNPNPRGGNMGGAQTSSPASSTGPTAGPTEDRNGAGAHQPITGNTQGVLGMPDVKLSAPGETQQGSVVTSDKNNVKLESGTLMLLRVSGTTSAHQ